MIAHARDVLISAGLEEVARVYPANSLKRLGAEEGFELCRTLETQEEYENVLRARHSREHRMVRGFYKIKDATVEQMIEETCGPPIETSDDDYWKHRYGTLQVEFVYNRLMIFWMVP